MDMTTALVKMVSALAVVIGLMALTGYGVRRFFGPRLGASSDGPLMRIQASLSLGVKKEIALVEVGKSFLVVGITPAQISLLARLEKENLVSPAPEEEKEDVRR